MYGIDRQSILDQVVHANSPNSEILNCGALAVPTIGPWCTTKVFEQFKFDPNKALDVLKSDGYTCAPGSGNPITTSAGDFPPVVCSKNGKPLVIKYSINAPNTRRAKTQELLKELTKTAGITFKIDNAPDSGTYFDQKLPHGDFNIADYASGGSNDPSNTSSFSCGAVPTKANSYHGGNWTHWCNADADTAMKNADQELDAGKRLADLTTVYQLQAQEFVLLPMYVLPNVGLWRDDQVAGPVTDYIPSNLGMFYNMNEWYTVGG
jgi:ABC-type transport system substrate-binding protein